MWGYGDRGLGVIVVGADSMGRMASFCTVGFYVVSPRPCAAAVKFPTYGFQTLTLVSLS